jgi:S1/P1 Nuclease
MTSSIRKAVAVLALALAGAAPAYPWGDEGHRALAMSATRDLSPEARSHVIKILGSDDLASISVWMDHLREAYLHAGPLATDPEAMKFTREFSHNNQWHYVDLPLGIAAYELSGPFSRPDDVVHMAEEAVLVLEGTGDPRITKLQALRMLVHFVGDEHQPLHVGCGFYQGDGSSGVKLVTDPSVATGLEDDKGGNTLFFGKSPRSELHWYWDTDLVLKITNSADVPALAEAIHKMADAHGAAWKTEGDHHHWPEAWATESLVAARTAYAGISFGAVELGPKGGIKRINITLPVNYDEVCTPLAAERLSKAGYHLAEILNAIQWSD